MLSCKVGAFVDGKRRRILQPTFKLYKQLLNHHQIFILINYTSLVFIIFHLLYTWKHTRIWFKMWPRKVKYFPWKTFLNTRQTFPNVEWSKWYEIGCTWCNGKYYAQGDLENDFHQNDDIFILYKYFNSYLISLALVNI